MRLTDDNLFNCPYLHMEDMGAAQFTEEEVVRLREYLLKGGFLWVDDFWGHAEWDYWVEQISRVLPPKDYPIFDLEAGSSAVPHAVSGQGRPADSVDSCVASRRQHLRVSARTASKSTAAASPTQPAG